MGSATQQHRPGNVGRRDGFTLIELLVVIAIISLLVSILMPSLHRAKELAVQTGCSSSMRQMGMAFAAYAEEDNGGRFPIVPYGTYGHNGYPHDSTTP